MQSLITAASPKEAAQTIEATFKKFGLVPTSCIPLSQSIRPEGMTIRVEFNEPIIVRFYLMHSGKILVDSEIQLDTIEKLIDDLVLDPTPLHWVADRAGKKAKLVDNLQAQFTRDVRPLLQFFLKFEKVAADLAATIVEVKL